MINAFLLSVGPFFQFVFLIFQCETTGDFFCDVFPTSSELYGKLPLQFNIT